MAQKQSEGVRIGPITLVTLISVLLLAVLAVLCVTTANATQAMAQRHAEATSETYAIDSCGQAFVAELSNAAVPPMPRQPPSAATLSPSRQKHFRSAAQATKPSTRR